jgi:predicted small lipoprotein YifL
MLRPRRLALAVCLLLGATLAACGKKGDPEPPIRMVPAGTTQLSVVQRGDELLLELPYPQTTAAGTPLPRVSEVAVWRLVWPVPAGVTGAPEVDERRFLVAATPARVVAEDELPEVVRGGSIALSLPVPEPPAEAAGAARTAVTLAVKTAGPGGEESAFSNRVTYLLVEPPAPPTGLQAEGLQEGVRLEWRHEVPAASPAGEGEEADDAAEEAPEAEAPAEPGLAGFNVYRRKATERAYGPPLRALPAATRTFTDEGALFGERYIYAVAAVATRQPVVVESRLAEAVEVDYRDLYAPPVPEGLVALVQTEAQEGRVRLVWEGSRAPDLAGYLVYRRSPDTQEFRPMTPEPIPATEYQDRDLAAGATYSYRVTAVDRTGNESAPSETAVAVIR